MEKSSGSTPSIYIAIAGAAVGVTVLWIAVAHSVGIPFVHGGTWNVLLTLAYGLLSLASVWILVRNDLIQRAWVQLSRRDRTFAVAGLVVGPLMLSNVLFLLIPWLGSALADQGAEQEFIFVSVKPYARTSRGLVQVELVDEKGGEHLVIFKKERVNQLGMKCGDTLMTKGRRSFLGYVIDSEVKATNPPKQCPLS